MLVELHLAALSLDLLVSGNVGVSRVQLSHLREIVLGLTRAGAVQLPQPDRWIWNVPLRR